MDADIRARVKAYQICAMSKPPKCTKFGYLASDTASAPMEKIFIDYVGKLPRSKSGNSYALVCVDAFTRFAWIFPVREANTSMTVLS
jgi:hypothetical protein